MKNNQIKNLSFVLLLSILTVGCNLSDSEKIVDNREIVEGLYFTNEDSPEVYFRYGNPPELVSVPIQQDTTIDGSRNIPKDFFLPVPYPNPADGNQFFTLHIPVQTHVKGWIEKARWIDEEKEEVLEPRTLELVDQELQAGTHMFTPEMSVRCRGGDFEEGFYRVKFQAYDTTLSVDIYLFSYVENMPDSMQIAGTFYGCR